LLSTANLKQPRIGIAGDIGGTTKTPGIYFSDSTIGITGDLTLDAQGISNGVFLFVAGSALTTATSSRVLLTNGAQSCYVYWALGSSATLGTYSSFVGTVLASASVTLATGANVTGRLLAGAAITLDTNIVKMPPLSLQRPLSWIARKTE